MSIRNRTHAVRPGSLLIHKTVDEDFVPGSHTFFDKRTGELFHFVESRIANSLPVSQIEINGEVYSVVRNAASDDVFIYHDLNLYNELKKVWGGELSEDIQKWKSWTEEYKDLSYWNKEVNKLGEDGYGNIFNKELIVLKEKTNLFIQDTARILNKKFINQYLQYTQSTMSDLSIINGVWCFFWNGSGVFRHNHLRNVLGNNPWEKRWVRT